MFAPALIHEHEPGQAHVKRDVELSNKPSIGFGMIKEDIARMVREDLASVRQDFADVRDDLANIVNGALRPLVSHNRAA